ncbi:2-amino-4-hydroxy-6-hydroxymethyldihydropteridine diphosphokinase [Hymenobacter caeli]|uniref:2-amino-4-hydroxy-6-hydroxymethyldihydropteridine pyrophosphokinase n=1 Tax=Hymenobacter caeli TaxID=2735894 RepID=A0ABX2FSI0_9BACT|nr:2-amino-4-hydroxy-6-hydroxymethyldihydropteridine diphosphokinase [Hymenobacter caeli]NRT20146.1 2-amino-4-hydroxy-6-hydroxymethyldihydropteridine diphosphokinase [Hymenobacter caeli]
MSAPVLAYLLLGSNLGDRAAYLRRARAGLAAAGEIVAVSGLYETAAWGRADQPAYLNQAVALRTALAPAALLAHCLATEAAAGRERHERWGSRTLDVDILLYGNEIIDSQDLTVPHPRLPLRRFALVPLAEIAAAAVHPQLHQTVAELLAACPDELAVRPWPGE